jgi:nucleotide-binding universal stress UspA family protein
MSAQEDQQRGPTSAASADIRRVVVGVDDTQSGLAAVATAITLARSHDAKLVAVRAWTLGQPRHGGRRMRHLTHPHIVLSFSGSEQCAASRVLVHGVFDAVAGGTPRPVVIQTPECDPALALVGIASQPGDVLVVGTNPGHPARRVVHGSVSRYCARHAACPVLVVPGRGQLPRQAADASPLYQYDNAARNA